MYSEIKKCRICGNESLKSVLHLGEQYLSGVFPKSKEMNITAGPLEIVKCHSDKDNFCGLLQLRHSYDNNEMYGDNYGYRSGLNQSMVIHLHKKVEKIISLIDLAQGDMIIDIGSNDSTLLQGYPQNRYELVGIDPTGEKFKKYYLPSIKLIPDFFTSKIVEEKFNGRKAKIITSIAMFYDLESPMHFMQNIYDVLDNDGLWIFEQSYMPTMLEMKAYDTVCHEHLEYYGLKQIKWMTDRIGFKIIDVELNNINGGSFSVIVAKKTSKYKEDSANVERILSEEYNKGLNSLRPYNDFKQRVYEHKNELNKFIAKVKSEKKTLLGYGASTKGNIILQFCNLTEKDIPFIAEVNSDKFGSYTPGTFIPIISEKEARAIRPDYFMVLPWHFKENIVIREAQYLQAGGKLFFPLPNLEIVDKSQ